MFIYHICSNYTVLLCYDHNNPALKKKKKAEKVSNDLELEPTVLTKKLWLSFVLLHSPPCHHDFNDLQVCWESQWVLSTFSHRYQDHLLLLFVCFSFFCYGLVWCGILGHNIHIHLFLPIVDCFRNIVIAWEADKETKLKELMHVIPLAKDGLSIGHSKWCGRANGQGGIIFLLLIKKLQGHIQKEMDIRKGKELSH